MPGESKVCISICDSDKEGSPLSPLPSPLYPSAHNFSADFTSFDPSDHEFTLFVSGTPLCPSFCGCILTPISACFCPTLKLSGIFPFPRIGCAYVWTWDRGWVRRRAIHSTGAHFFWRKQESSIRKIEGPGWQVKYLEVILAFPRCSIVLPYIIIPTNSHHLTLHNLISFGVSFTVLNQKWRWWKEKTMAPKRTF